MTSTFRLAAALAAVSTLAFAGPLHAARPVFSFP